MKYAPVFGVLLLVLAAAAPATAATSGVSAQESDCSFPVERTDLSGTTVTVEEEPSRVVTLNPSAAQTMWEMGAQDRVVGVTKHAMNLEGAEEKTNVSGGGRTINTEEVVGLEPDLVLAPNTVDNATVAKLREAGLTVYHFREAKSIEDIEQKTRIIGELTGECEAAEETVAWMDSELERVDRAVEGQEKPDIIYAFFGYTAGNDTFIHTLMERAGTNNVAADAGIESYEEINDEILVEQDPDWIMLNTDDDQVPKTAAYNGTTAVQEDQVIVVDTNWLNRPGPRVVYAVTKIAQAVHPEAYAQANQTETVQTTGEPTASPTEATETAAEATEEGATGASGPGFTAVGALLALVCVALLAIRREV